jgi:hypothetical protein
MESPDFLHARIGDNVTLFRSSPFTVTEGPAGRELPCERGGCSAVGTNKIGERKQSGAPQTLLITPDVSSTIYKYQTYYYHRHHGFVSS